MKRFGLMSSAFALSIPAWGASHLVAGDALNSFCNTLGALLGSPQAPMEFSNATPSFPFTNFLEKSTMNHFLSTESYVGQCNGDKLKATVHFRILMAHYDGSQTELELATYSLNIDGGVQNQDELGWTLDASVLVNKWNAAELKPQLSRLLQEGAPITAKLGPNALMTRFLQTHEGVATDKPTPATRWTQLETTYAIFPDSPVVRVLQTQSLLGRNSNDSNHLLQISTHTQVGQGQPLVRLPRK